MQSNQPQKTGISGLPPVTLMLARSSILSPPKHLKESLWWSICGQSALYSMGLMDTVEPSGFLTRKFSAVGISPPHGATVKLMAAEASYPPFSAFLPSFARTFRPFVPLSASVGLHETQFLLCQPERSFQ